MATRPDYVTDEHLKFLDGLRESGETNMFGAYPYLVARFNDMPQDDARKILSYWMNSFGSDDR